MDLKAMRSNLLDEGQGGYDQSRASARPPIKKRQVSNVVTRPPGTSSGNSTNQTILTNDRSKTTEIHQMPHHNFQPQKSTFQNKDYNKIIQASQRRDQDKD